MAFPNKYAKVCSRPGCGTYVKVNEGVTTKGAAGWMTWCKECCPERLAPATRPATRRVLTVHGEVITPYEPANLPLVRSFPGARFHGNKEECRTCKVRHPEAFWSVSLADSDRERVLEIADRLKLDVAPELRRVAVTEQAQNAQVAGLYPYQVQGVNWLSKQERALLGDEMGLGKTIQTLVALPPNAKVLVVCPNTLKYNWRDEAVGSPDGLKTGWRKDYQCFVVNGSAEVRNPRPGEIVIINYDVLPDFLLPPERKRKEDWKNYAPRLNEFREALKAAHPDLADVILVVDEAHKVKSMDAQRSLKIRELSFLCGRTWGLTGTPLLNKPLDLWGLLSNLHLQWKVFGSWAGFQRCFNVQKQYIRGARREVTVYGDPTPEVPEFLRRAMLQRKRAEVLPDLPKKTYTDILVSLDDVEGGSAIKKELDSLASEFGTLMEVKEELPPFTSFSAVREKIARACIPALREYVDNCEEQEVPLVVASAHLAPLDELLGRDGWAVISGTTPNEQRQLICRQQVAGLLKGVACSINAAGVGLNLTGASRMVFVDLDWVPANNWQMEDRICRIGQTANKCEIVRFVVDHPLVRHIYKLLAKKIALISAAVDAKVEAVLPVAPPGGSEVEETEEQFQARMKRVQEAIAEAEKREEEQAKAKAKEIGKAKALVVLDRETERAQGTPRQLLPLTTARIEAVRRAFKYMLSVCDGAHAKDYQGFNKPDAVVAHCILGSGLETTDEINAAYWMLSRYPRQLSEREPLLFSEKPAKGKKTK